jgi:hypothetical protein
VIRLNTDPIAVPISTVEGMYGRYGQLNTAPFYKWTHLKHRSEGSERAQLGPSGTSVLRIDCLLHCTGTCCVLVVMYK